jgi:SAM-dependent methyltransferase
VSTSAVKDYYERYWSDGYFADNPYEQWKMERVRKIVLEALPDTRVLDVGCGDGHTLADLASHGVRGFGIDLSDVAIKDLRARGLDGARADIDGGALPVESGSFGIVLCLDVFEHLFAPERLLKEIHRALVPGGLLIAAVPNGLNLFNRLAFLVGRHIDLMDKAHLSATPFSEHIRFFSKDVFEAFLVAGGFVPRQREFFFPDRFTDARFRAAQSLGGLVNSLGLHRQLPALLALGFLYACERTGASRPARDSAKG